MVCCFGKREFSKESLQDGKILSDRSCTDCCMILFYLVFLIGWIIIAVVAFTLGDPSRILLPENFRGDTCGVDALANWTDSFVPRPSRPTYTICVSYCPSVLDYVCNNDLEPLLDNPNITLPNTHYDHLAAEVVAGPAAVAACAFGTCSPALQANATRYLGLLTKVDQFKCFLVYYSSGPTLYRCYPFSQSTNATLAAAAGDTESSVSSFSDSIGATQFFQRGFAETEYCWRVILICCFTAMVISMIWIFLLRCFLAPLIYLCLLLILVLLVLIGYGAYLEANDLQDVQLPGDTATQNQVTLWRTIQYVAWVGAGIYVVVMIWLIKRIRIAIAVMKEGSKAFLSSPGLILIPPVVFVLVLGFIAWWIVVAIYIQTIGSVKASDFVTAADTVFGSSVVNATLNAANQTSHAVSSLASNYNVSGLNATVNTTSYSTSDYIKILHAYNFFGFLWMANFCIMFGFFIIAMSTTVWYFSATAIDIDNYENGDAAQREQGRLKTTPWGTGIRAFCAAIRYHLGTILWGSLLIAIIQFIRVLFLYIQEEFLDDWKENATAKIIIYCVDCCLAYIERVIRIISKNAFVICCIKNTSFCDSASEALSILAANAVRVGTLATMSGVACFILKIFIVGTNMIIAYYLIQQKSLTDNQTIQSGLFPMVGIFILSFIIAALFVNVYESCTDTVMMCFLVDEKELEGAFMPPALAELVDQFKQVEEARRNYEKSVKEASSQKEVNVHGGKAAAPTGPESPAPAPHDQTGK